MTKAEMKAALIAKYGYHRQHCERYISLARKQNTARLEKNLDALLAEQHERFDRIAENPLEGTADKLRAIEGIIGLYGLNAPQQISGPDGGPVQFSLMAMVQAIQQAKQSPPALEE